VQQGGGSGLAIAGASVPQIAGVTGHSRGAPDAAKLRRLRVLAATRKRHAHRLANEMTTDVQNEPENKAV